MAASIRLVRRLALPALLVAGPCALSAQGANGDLPAPLVTALLTGLFGGPVRTSFTVDTVPGGWPAVLLPDAPARVIGGMRTRQLVAVFGDSASRKPLAAYEAQLVRLGWKQPVSEQERGFGGGLGLMAASVADGRWCRDSAFVQVTAAPAPAGLQFMRITYWPDSRGLCEPARARRTATLQLPALTPPRGVHAIGTGSGSGGDQVEGQARLTGVKSTVAELLAHYAAQLVAAGWTAFATASQASVGVQPFEARDSTGTVWRGGLVAAELTGGHDISLRMVSTVSR
jgi:hypothetical protein